VQNRINEKIMYTSYKRNNRWLGIIDYKSLFIILVYVFIIINVLDILNISFEKSIYIFIFFTVPIVSVMIINVNNESIISVIISITLFMLNKKVFVDKQYIKIFNDIYK